MQEKQFGDFPVHIPEQLTDKDSQYYREIQEYFTQSLGTNVDKLRNFTKFVPRSELSRFLAKNTIFQNILNVHGHIIECGVFLGGGA